MIICFILTACTKFLGQRWMMHALPRCLCAPSPGEGRAGRSPAGEEPQPGASGPLLDCAGDIEG